MINDMGPESYMFVPYLEAKLDELGLLDDDPLFQIKNAYEAITADDQFTMTLIVGDGLAGSYPAGGWNRVSSITDQWSGYTWEHTDQTERPDFASGPIDYLAFSREDESLVFWDLEGLVQWQKGENSRWYKAVQTDTDDPFSTDIYHYLRRWYDETELEALRQGIAIPGEGRTRDEIARGLLPKVDYVAGVPDSGVPHAIGYANRSGKPFARPFVKYTPTWPRSFMPANQNIRNQVAKMKQIPVPELIEGKKLLFVDDSIVRGTQLRETIEFLYSCGAEEVHMRSACPPVMYGCKYLNFSRSNSDMELLARAMVQKLEGDEGQEHLDEYADGSTERGKCLLKTICEDLGFSSLGYQSLEGLLEAIGIDKETVCTYCWTGKE